MTEPVTPTTNELVYQCIVDLHGAGKIPTREVIVAETRLKFSVVDDHVKRLRDDGRITKVVNGVFHPVVMHTEYPSTASVLQDGRVKIEYGDMVMTLTPRGAKDVGNLLAGFAYHFGRY